MTCVIPNTVKENGTPLTDRELEILWLAANGFSTPEIGELLYISAETVKSHRRHILGRMGCRTMTQVVHEGHLRGWFGTLLPGASNDPSPESERTYGHVRVR